MIAAGIGFRRGCSADEITAVLRAAEAQAGVRANVLAAPAFKAGDAALDAQFAVPLRLIGDAALAAAQQQCATFSEMARAQTGFASVAEACALAAAGPGARLLLPRIAHASATCALAEGRE